MLSVTIEDEDNERNFKQVIISSTRRSYQDPVIVGTVYQNELITTTEEIVANEESTDIASLVEYEDLVNRGYVIDSSKVKELSKINIDKKTINLQELKSIRAEQKLPQLEISTTTFVLLNEKLLSSMSVADITSPEDSGSGTINDPKLGITKDNNLCLTCKRGAIGCPGHLGKINLHEPIFNPLYMRTIISVLTCICPSCGSLIIDPSILAQPPYNITMNMPAELRLKAIEAATKELDDSYIHKPRNPANNEDNIESCGDVSRCMPNVVYIIYPKAIYNEYGKIMYISSMSAKQRKKEKKKERSSDEKERTAEEVLKIFHSLETNYPEDVKLLGFSDNKPSDLIMRSIPVLSPIERGSSPKEGLIQSDHFNRTYKDIIILNNKIRDYDKLGDTYKKGKKRDKSGLITDLWQKVSFLIKSDKDDELGYTSKGQSSVNTVLSKKKGLFRGTLMASRVNTTARSVIGPAPDLEYGEVGVPKSMAPYLTIRVKVAAYNLKAMTILLRNGKVTHVVRNTTDSSGLPIKIDDRNRETYNLNIGDDIFRWLQDGDRVTLNRQPTLHRHGYMSARVKLIDSLTISLPLSYTPGYNADFDGDEMNLHTVQTLDAMAELSTLMSFEECIINEQTSSPVVGLVMDNTLAAYLLTMEDNIIPIEVWNNCLTIIKNRDSLGDLDKRLLENGILLREPNNITSGGYNIKYTGKALFSALLPKGFYYLKGNVKINDGILVEGILTKQHVGNVSNSIIQSLYLDSRFGAKIVSDFLTDSSRVLNYWLTTRGFTIGFGDCLPPPQLNQIVLDEVAKAKIMMEEESNLYDDDPNENKRRESAIIMKLNKVREIVGSKMSQHPDMKNNAFHIMITSGSKGSMLNLSQLLGLVGQQTAWGERIPRSITGGTRSLPHFMEDSNSIESRGFITKSFSEGLSLSDFVNQAQAAREGVIVSSDQIPIIGKMRRTLARALETTHIAYDGSTCDANGHIIQFKYGSDGFSPSKVKQVTHNGETIYLPVDFWGLAAALNAKYGAL